MKLPIVAAQRETQQTLNSVSPFWSHVVEVDSDGSLWLATDVGLLRGTLAIHIPFLRVGQIVVAMLSPDRSSALIIAAQPLEDQVNSAPFSYNAENEVLEIRGVKVKLVGQREVAIECGDACLVVSEDGSIRTSGERILSAAIETNRIEGGSIEFN